jgi:ABC-type sugar transport system substrate-binding protein
LICVLLVACFLQAFGCKRNQPLTPKPATSGFIGVLGSDPTDPFFKVMRSRVSNYRYGGRPIELRFDAPANRDAEEQMKIVRKWQAQNLVGLCIRVVDAQRQLHELLKLRTSGIAVVTMMEELDHADPFLHVGPDERALGEDLAELVSKSIGTKGTLGLVVNADASPAGKKRFDAFRHRLRTYGLLHVLSEEDCQGKPQAAIDMINERMRRYPNLNAWVSLENWPLKSQQDVTTILTGRCKFITVDAVPSMPVWKSDLHFGGAVVNHFDEIIDEAIAICSHVVRGDTLINKRITSEYSVVTPDRRNEFQNRWDRWLNQGQQAPAGQHANDP